MKVADQVLLHNLATSEHGGEIVDWQQGLHSKGLKDPSGGNPPSRRWAMKTVMLKACTRCSGDMALGNDDEVGLHAACVQCGYVAYLRYPQLAVGKAA